MNIRNGTRPAFYEGMDGNLLTQEATMITDKLEIPTADGVAMIWNQCNGLDGLVDMLAEEPIIAQAILLRVKAIRACLLPIECL